MTLMEKLAVLTDAAKYDAACTSSGSQRTAGPGSLGSTTMAGICHSFSADGRCISLLNVLFSNCCIYNCQYCVNRVSRETKRASFTPEELAELTIGFYRRNYIEGLFLSSGVLRSPDYTCEQMIRTLELLRNHYQFGGYIHVKAIPGADPLLIEKLGLLADRMSVNIELPSQEGLRLLAPDKSKHSILRPMGYIAGRIVENTRDLTVYRHAPRFAPAGQSTQMIIGATPDSDRQILSLAEGLYRRYGLKRVFYSAYLPVTENALLPAPGTKPPLLREHRLYQADWLLRFYGFTAGEILDEANPNFNPFLDPKANWAVHHLDQFPVEVNTAPYEMLLRVPGVGVRSARRIIAARRTGSLDFDALKRMGVVLKRAQYFLLCRGKQADAARFRSDNMLQAVLSDKAAKMLAYPQGEQLSLFRDPGMITKEDVAQCLTGEL